MGVLVFDWILSGMQFSVPRLRCHGSGSYSRDLDSFAFNRFVRGQFSHQGGPK